MSRKILATPGQRKANKVWQECLNYANALSRHKSLSLQEIWQVYYQRVRIGLRSCSVLRPRYPLPLLRVLAIRYLIAGR